ncbi:branched-chain amino acid ABC transporter substrate-binding protein [Burkholderia sp. Bp9142]|uniref:branched-chain amino acid ABC transporter substrate-binding protein n=1 Tax=Burkholderia sp. Bp9142 TaxID=2184573 RepID=UPI000F5AB477|nr:branched-chain amino acid ABC transporter substrate-binding protein [Burkholderia sp. Bp9142]RQR26166.1 branched-chain amino acid ABC transporter substrate-binding protein [Burkholderia sp. Bp9142]
MRLNALCFLNLLVAASTASFSFTAQAETQTVKLGFAGPLTGAQAQYGSDYQSGVQLAIDDFNATRPTVDGKETTFALVPADDQADPKTGTIVAQRLVDDGIKGMLGHFNSGVSIPASAIYAKAGIPEIAVSTAPAYTRQGFKTTFRMMTSDTQQGGVMGKYVVEKLQAKRIAIVDDRTAYGQGLAAEFEKGVKAAGGNIIAHEYTTDKSTDFKSILTVLKAAHPDFIYYAGADSQSAPMVKQAKSLAMSSAFVSGDMSKTDEFLKVAGPAANGTFVSLPGLPPERMPGWADFEKRFKAKFGTKPGTYAPYSYDGAMAMMRSMVAANSSTPSVYLPKLAKIDMNGVTTDHFSYDQYGDLRRAVISVYKCENGVWVPKDVISSN